jgi:hypothetical protein
MSANMEIIDLTSSDSESESACTSKKRMPSHGAEEHATKATKLAHPPTKLRRPLSPYNHTLDSSLFQHGVLVMSLPADVFESFDLNAYLHEMPEFKTLCGKPLGSFGRFGHASSFHHPLIRALRRRIFREVSNRLRGIFGHGWFIQNVLDGFCERTAGFSESLHRDCSVVYTAEDDAQRANGHVERMVLGGYTNLSNKTIYFSCVTGTQYAPSGNSGFDKCSPEEVIALTPHLRLVAVPPFHHCAFNEQVKHEVFSVPKHTTESYRLFGKFYLTRDGTSIFPEDQIRECVESQGIPKLSPKQLPPMYAQNHLCYPKNRVKLAEYCERFIPECIDSKNGFVYRYAPTMSELSARTGRDLMFPAYEEDETAELLPHPLV